LKTPSLEYWTVLAQTDMTHHQHSAPLLSVGDDDECVIIIR